MTKISLAVLSVLFASSSFAQPLWQRTNGPGGANINEICFDSSGGSYILTSGAYRSPDNGATWQQLPEIPSQLHTLPNGDLTGTIGTSTSISHDHGLSWIPILSSSGSVAVTTSGEIFVGTTTHLFRTKNEGVSWDTLAPTPIQGRLMAFITPTIFMLGGYYRSGTSGLYRSTDDGAHWSKVVNGLSPNNDYGDCLAGTAGGVLFYVNREERAISTDDGRTWKTLSSNNDIQPVVSINRQGVVAVSAGGSIHLYDLTGKEGAILGSFPKSGSYSDLVDKLLTFSQSGDFWLSGDPLIGRINVTTETSFTFVAPPTGIVSAIIADGIGSVIVNSQAAYDNNYDPSVPGPFMYKSTNAGSSWSTLTNQMLAPLVLDSSHGIIGGIGAAVARSTDGGSTWKQLGSGLTSTGITSLVVDGGGFIYMGCGEGVFRSTDNGSTWDQLIAGITDQNILSLTVNAAGDVFAGTASAIYHSSDHAMTWSALPFTPPDASGVSSLVVNTSGDLIAVVRDTGVYWSHDNGLTWSSIGSGLSGKVNALLSTPIGHVFAGTDNGVYYLPSGGGTWVNATSGLGVRRVISITRDPAGTVYLGTDGFGVYSSTQTYNSAHATVASTPAIPIERVYPNPSHGEISMEFPGIRNASIEVYDLLGRSITKQSASERWTWQSNQPAGTYILHLTGTDDSGKAIQRYQRFVVE